jgi:hypothetical protein
MNDELDILTLVTETRAKILRGEDVSLDELQQALAAVRRARAALIGAKPPKAAKPKSKVAKKDLLDEIFGEVVDDSGQGL